MFSSQRCRVTPNFILSWVILAQTVVLLVPIASGYEANVYDRSGPLEPVVFPRIGRSVSDDSLFFKAAKSLPRIGKRVNNNEIFPGVRRLLKPLPRVGRSSHDGDDNFLLKGTLTSDVFKVMEPHHVFRRAGTSDQQQTLLEPDFLKGFKALPRIGRRDQSDHSDLHSAEETESHPGDKRALTSGWSNGELPWFRQQDGPVLPSKKSGLADLMRLTALPWEDAVLKEKPQEVPLAVVTLTDDRDAPDAWHYNVFADSDHRLE